MRVSKGPRYYRSKKAWFANLGNKRHPLISGPKGATEAEAVRLYNDLVSAANVAVEGDGAKCWAVLNAYLVWASTRTEPKPLSKNSLEIAKFYLDSACEAFGEVAVKDLSPTHVQDWLASKKPERGAGPKGKKPRGWGPGGRRLAVDSLNTAFRWATGPGDVCTTNPMAKMGRAPSINYRGRMGLLTPEAFRDFVSDAIGRANRDFAYVLLLLNATGARPGEVARVRAEEWRDDLGAFVIDPENGAGRFKLARRGDSRTVYVPEDLVPLVRSLVRRRGTGNLFLTEKGKPITTASLCNRVKAARKRGVDVPAAFSIYGLRHGFVTRWMATPGCDVRALAALLNTSIQQIEKTYSHLFKEHDALRRAVSVFERARERPSGGGG